MDMNNVAEFNSKAEIQDEMKRISKLLAMDLSPDRISDHPTKKIDGKPVSYLEGWWVEMEMNNVFGFFGWSQETIYNEIPDGGTGEKAGGGTRHVAYVSKVRVTVTLPTGAVIVREGTGTGMGYGKTWAECMDTASKAAETDAFKRACKSFGARFGLALYEKPKRGGEREFVDSTPEEKINPKTGKKQTVAESRPVYKEMAVEIDCCESMEALEGLFRSKAFKEEYARLSPGWKKNIQEHKNNHKIILAQAGGEQPDYA